MLWLVAAVAMPSVDDTAPTAPESVNASLMLKRSEMNVEPRPSASPAAHLVDQLDRRLRRAREHVEAELVQLVHPPSITHDPIVAYGRIVLPVDATTIRLFLHVLAATVWVGGQIALAGVVPVVRRVGGAEATRAVARRFQFVAWPAFALLVVTGVWNLFAVKVGDQSGRYLTTLLVKLILVAVSGAFAAAHIVVARRRPALGGALAGLALLAALGATFLGVLLAG